MGFDLAFSGKAKDDVAIIESPEIKPYYKRYSFCWMNLQNIH